MPTRNLGNDTKSTDSMLELRLLSSVTCQDVLLLAPRLIPRGVGALNITLQGTFRLTNEQTITRQHRESQ